MFIHATLNPAEPGLEAQRLLTRVEKEEIEASTSALTVDEVIWVVKRMRGMDRALEVGDALINMRGLELISVDENVLRDSLGLMRLHGFDQRDAIHAASALRCGADFIVSSDSHFDSLGRPPRKTITDKV
ncbi:type II toxin-antitoxin system VapC family toxin [Candidatus Bathyarchaeota archaeon]|nr:type II toxin-antitoxin system VapC family toxin [Candidatus Bathyarchaeota archaeon]